MAKIVGYRPIKTKKGESAYIVAYTDVPRAGQGGHGVEAGEQFVMGQMFDEAFAGVSPEKIVGMEVVFMYNKTGFLDGLYAASKQ